MRLLVVTDIHGRPGFADCLSLRLSGRKQMIVRTIGLSELLGVDCTGESLHRRLVEGDGFEQAAKRLIDLAEHADVALGYSAGGMVLWQSVLHGLSLDRLICISSTRLRQVSAAAVPIPVLAVFGENDSNRPADAWGTCSRVQTYLIPGAGHDFYASEGPARDLCLTRVASFLS